MAKADRESIAEELTYYHLLNDPDIVHAFYVTRAGGDAASEPLKLLQVSSEASTVGIVPIYFGASKEVPYPVVIILLSEVDYSDLLTGKLNLPDGWDCRVEVLRSAA
jgi:hypothetical protein